MKNTKQRECIHDVLRVSQQALSPEELFLECQKKLPSIGIATIHRELKRLREENELEEVVLANDVLRFCLKEKHHHHHFKCSSCNRVYDIGCGGVSANLPDGFKNAEHDVNFYGLCKNCS